MLVIWIPAEREELAEITPAGGGPTSRRPLRRQEDRLSPAVEVTAREEVLATIAQVYIEGGR